MRIQFSPGKLQGAERTNVLQEVQRQVKNAALMVIKPVLASFLVTSPASACSVVQAAMVGSLLLSLSGFP